MVVRDGDRDGFVERGAFRPEVHHGAHRIASVLTILRRCPSGHVEGALQDLHRDGRIRHRGTSWDHERGALDIEPTSLARRDRQIGVVCRYVDDGGTLHGRLGQRDARRVPWKAATERSRGHDRDDKQGEDPDDEHRSPPRGSHQAARPAGNGDWSRPGRRRL